jgi:hypothetical protein
MKTLKLKALGLTALLFAGAAAQAASVDIVPVSNATQKGSFFCVGIDALGTFSAVPVEMLEIGRAHV